MFYKKIFYFNLNIIRSLNWKTLNGISNSFDAVQVLCDSLNIHLVRSLDAYHIQYVYEYNFNCRTTVGIRYFSLWMGCIFIDQWAWTSNNYQLPIEVNWHLKDNHKLYMKQMGCKKCLKLRRRKARFGIFWMPFWWREPGHMDKINFDLELLQNRWVSSSASTL